MNPELFRLGLARRIISEPSPLVVPAVPAEVGALIAAIKQEGRSPIGELFETSRGRERWVPGWQDCSATERLGELIDYSNDPGGVPFRTWEHEHGYLYAVVPREDGKRTFCRVPRLVAHAWIEKPLDWAWVEYTADHKDHDVSHNWPGNLKWRPKSENCADNHPQRQEPMSEREAGEVRYLFEQGLARTKVAELVGRNVSTVSRIKADKTWIGVPAIKPRWWDEAVKG
jgi:hypothetical protein